jgi:hypothetical protein
MGFETAQQVALPPLALRSICAAATARQYE